MKPVESKVKQLRVPLRLGDKVKLISDMGPVMTLIEIVDDLCNCIWFDSGNDECTMVVFREEVLKKVQ